MSQNLSDSVWASEFLLVISLLPLWRKRLPPVKPEPVNCSEWISHKWQQKAPRPSDRFQLCSALPPCSGFGFSPAPAHFHLYQSGLPLAAHSDSSCDAVLNESRYREYNGADAFCLLSNYDGTVMEKILLIHLFSVCLRNIFSESSQTWAKVSRLLRQMTASTQKISTFGVSEPARGWKQPLNSGIHWCVRALQYTVPRKCRQCAGHSYKMASS